MTTFQREAAVTVLHWLKADVLVPLLEEIRELTIAIKVLERQEQDRPEANH